MSSEFKILDKENNFNIYEHTKYVYSSKTGNHGKKIQQLRVFVDEFGIPRLNNNIKLIYSELKLFCSLLEIKTYPYIYNLKNNTYSVERTENNMIVLKIQNNKLKNPDILEFQESNLEKVLSEFQILINECEADEDIKKYSSDMLINKKGNTYFFGKGQYSKQNKVIVFQTNNINELFFNSFCHDIKNNVCSLKEQDGKFFLKVHNGQNPKDIKMEHIYSKEEINNIKDFLHISK